MAEEDLSKLSNDELIAKAKETTDAPLTDYVILRRDDNGFWKMYADSASARSADGAIRAIGKEGTFVAIPARSFKPVTVKAETKTVLKLGEAT